MNTLSKYLLFSGNTHCKRFTCRNDFVALYIWLLYRYNIYKNTMQLGALFNTSTIKLSFQLMAWSFCWNSCHFFNMLTCITCNVRDIYASINKCTKINIYFSFVLIRIHFWTILTNNCDEYTFASQHVMVFNSH